MTSLEEQYSELKDIVKQRTIQNYITDPALLEHWNPGDIVIKHSLWTTPRLVLNKVASENITDLFPSDWHPRPIMSTDDEKQYKVLTELMTHMFQQCVVTYLKKTSLKWTTIKTFSKHYISHMCTWVMCPLPNLFTSSC